MKKILMILCASFLLAGCSPKASGELNITIFNAGEADAILFKTDTDYILMDTGEDINKEDLVKSLQEKGVEKINTLILTNFGADHIGGADLVLNTFDVDRVYVTYESKKSLQITEFENALRNNNIIADVVSRKTISSCGANFEVIGPHREYTKYEALNTSLITKVTFGTNTFLFMGDAHDQRTIDFMQDEDPKADFIKVAYHGNPLPVYEEFFAKVGAKQAVICNAKRHPMTKEVRKTVAFLEEAGTEVFQTKRGTVEINATPETFTVIQQ